MSETTDPRSDEELFDRYRRGDVDAFAVLYGRWKRPMLAFLRARIMQADEADDLYQELWLRVVDARERFGADGFRFWLFRIARNLLIDRARRANLRSVEALDAVSEPADPTPAPEQRSIAMDCIERFRAAFAELPDEQREALALKEESGLDLEAIARMAGCGRETIKSRLRYAYRRLRERLGDCL
ncbi:MAG: sigma-70 family RNA polymerase sigma factor [Chromatiales bacterium]|nr:sigma-70 family RNA polymerase sigma factor [Chromatiales bacterium]